ncbi:MAG TPA: hypothetical protein PKJ00_03400 [Verrucomicrobiota bacterium]|nr:hypothetical protein [Verrucomicrobiota bacterium]HNS69008.1 hypothetical protein [Verrucomicrobiota bacterium]
MRILGDKILARWLPQASDGKIIWQEGENHFHDAGPKVFSVVSLGTSFGCAGDFSAGEVQVGDRVLCHHYEKGPEPFFDTRDLFVITTDQIIAVIPSTVVAAMGNKEGSLPKQVGTPTNCSEHRR